MTQRTKTINKGVYEVRDETEGAYVYRTTCGGVNRPWFLFKTKRGETDNWKLLDGEFRSKDSAVDYALERIEEDNKKTNDILDHIDDGINLDDEL
jgi:hypothetical protein